MLTTEEVAGFITAADHGFFERFIIWAQRERQAGNYACFAIVPQGMSTAIGIFQVRSLEPGFGTAEWGFAMGSRYGGSGNDALRKIGAVQQGWLRRSFLRHGRHLDQVLWGILADDWRLQRASQRPPVVH